MVSPRLYRALLLLGALAGAAFFAWNALGAILIYGLHAFDFSFKGATEAHSQARAAFLESLPADADCLTRDDIAAAAAALGHRVDDRGEFPFCLSPAGLTGWLAVDISPPLPFSAQDENAELFGFDENGCAVDWSYGSGPGSTCP